MSDFLLVVPEGWTQLDWEFIANNVPGMDDGGTRNMINNNAYGDMEAALKGAGVLPEAATVAEAKLIDGTYFLVRLG